MPLIATARPYISEVSLHPDSSPVGFCIGGAVPGPNILISGSTRLTGQVFQRMLLLPTLSRLRGRLFLIQLDRLQHPADIQLIATTLIRGAIDAQMFLPFVNTGDMSADMVEDAVKEGYWSALRLCADNGMIAGRGIPRRIGKSHNEADFIAFSSRASRAIH
jgi:hypothetical protein